MLVKTHLSPPTHTPEVISLLAQESVVSHYMENFAPWAAPCLCASHSSTLLRCRTTTLLRAFTLDSASPAELKWLRRESIQQFNRVFNARLEAVAPQMKSQQTQLRRLYLKKLCQEKNCPPSAERALLSELEPSYTSSTLITFGVTALIAMASKHLFQYKPEKIESPTKPIIPHSHERPSSSILFTSLLVASPTLMLSALFYYYLPSPTLPQGHAKPKPAPMIVSPSPPSAQRAEGDSSPAPKQPIKGTPQQTAIFSPESLYEDANGQTPSPQPNPEGHLLPESLVRDASESQQRNVFNMRGMRE